MADRFLENIRKAREAADSGAGPEENTPKPIEQMRDQELEEAITAARRELLDAQHQELRERELSRVQGSEPSDPTPGSGLSEVLGNLQKRKRRTWR